MATTFMSITKAPTSIQCGDKNRVTDDVSATIDGDGHSGLVQCVGRKLRKGRSIDARGLGDGQTLTRALQVDGVVCYSSL